MGRVAGSFRDPAGQVFDVGGKIVRTINASYRRHWETAEASGLLEHLQKRGLIPSYNEAEPLPGAWKTLEVQRIDWISYPYEWSFFQLRAAARVTLQIHKSALERGMVLKDASAYNVQFIGSRPVFIDLLSFEEREEGEPWQAYRQFCMHFLAPLALYAYEARLGRFSSQWIDGIPLDLAWSLLPGRCFFSPGLQMHLHLHAGAEKKYSDARTSAGKVRKARVSRQGMLDVADSLLRTIDALPAPKQDGEWTGYYGDTNYTEAANTAKLALVEDSARNAAGGIAIDLGANTGRFSAQLAPYFRQVIAADIDAQAVGLHYQALRKHGDEKILPLVLDLANPSPAIGWACAERGSWLQRGQADYVSALALGHHLYFTCRIPWREQAAFFAALLRPGGILLLEFVPAEDSQVRRMLAARDNVFDDYNLDGLRESFAAFFIEMQLHVIPESSRVLLILQKK